MKWLRNAFFYALVLDLIPGLWGQTATTPKAVLVSALSALGGTKLQGISLTGTAEVIAGATDNTGTFNASCGIDGTSQLSIQAGDSSYTETRQVVNGSPTGTWTDSEGQPHAMVYHNVLTPAAWFCPAAALVQIVSATNLNIQYVGLAAKNGASAEHFIVEAPLADPSAAAALMTSLSQVDIYLDPQTLRPIVFDFTAHPDSNSGIDIAIEIQFSNYAETNGVWMPTTVQRYINSGLALNLQAQSATPTLSQQ